MLFMLSVSHLMNLMQSLLSFLFSRAWHHLPQSLSSADSQLGAEGCVAVTRICGVVPLECCRLLHLITSLLSLWGAVVHTSACV